MGKRRPDLVRRSQAIEKTMKRFGGKPLDFKSADCGRMARFHLKAMGHKKLPAIGQYTTPQGAAKQIKRLGGGNLADVLDSFLERIPPAMMLPGDLAMPPSDPDSEAAELGTVMVMASGRKFIGWHPDFETLTLVELLQIDRAWRA